MNKLFRKIALLSLAAVCLPFAACDDDDNNVGGGHGGPVSDDLNHIDLFAPENPGHLEYLGDGIFRTDAAEEITLLPVRSATPVTEDVKLTIKIAPINVDIYNLLHDTRYRHIGNFEVVNRELTIPKGQTESTEPIKVRFGHMAEFQDAKDDHMIALAVDSFPEGFSGGENCEMLVNFNKVFPPNPIEMMQHVSEFGLVYLDGAFINLKSSVLIPDLVTADHTAYEDITLQLAIDPSLVNEYNKKSEVKYEMFPNASLKNTNLTINKGKITADVEILFSDGMAAVEHGKMYIIPIRLKSVNGEGSVLGNDKVTYIRYNTNAKPDFANQVTPVGRQITDTYEWILTVDGKEEGGWYGDRWNNLLNNQAVDYIYPNQVFVADMHKPYNIVTVQLSTHDWYTSYNLEDFTIGTSLDGIKYEETTLHIDNPTIVNNLVLPAPRSARYIRVTSPNYMYPRKFVVFED